MWTTLIILAVAINFEPTRIGVIGLLLVRPRPIPQLLAFLCGSLLTAATAGAAVLYVLHQLVPANPIISSARVQIVVGAVIVVAAVILANHGSTSGSGELGDGRKPGISGGSRAVEWASGRAASLVRGTSPWLAGALGAGLALPSIDYLALLVLISSSGLQFAAQISALATFLIIANAIVLAPLISYLFMPLRTQAGLDQVRQWILGRSRRDYALLLGAVGILLIMIGIQGL